MITLHPIVVSLAEELKNRNPETLTEQERDFLTKYDSVTNTRKDG